MWQVFVKTVAGQSKTVNIDDPNPKEMKVSQFKKLVQDKTGIPTHEQRLIYGGRQFEDSKTLGDYPSLGPRATIFMVMVLKGGTSRRDKLDSTVIRTDETCMLSYEDGVAVKMPCGHAISPDWLMDYCWHEIDDGKYEIKCSLCAQEWPMEVLHKYGGANEEELHLLEEGLSKNYCEKASGIIQCPGCNSYCMRADESSNCMQCGICTKNKGKTYRFCYNCREEWTNGYNTKFCGNSKCSSSDNEINRILRDCEEKEVVGVKCPSIRECPKCKGLIEHKEACKHMTCKNCQTEFCFLCLRTRPSNGSWSCGSYNTPCVPAPRQA